MFVFSAAKSNPKLAVPPNPFLTQFLPTILLWSFAAVLPAVVSWSSYFEAHWTRYSILSLCGPILFFRFIEVITIFLFNFFKFNKIASTFLSQFKHHFLMLQYSCKFKIVSSGKVSGLPYVFHRLWCPSGVNHHSYMASSVSGQNEPNRAL